MASLSRTLKLSILGDVDGLNKSLKTAGQDVDGFGDKMGKAGKAIGAAFAAAAAAAAAYAIKIGIDGVKAAIEDEKAQTQLALALENATGATKDQIAATEQSILKMSLATGVADDDLRPALSRLVRSTGDTEKAQQLLAQALDISTATGKPLETVATALSKGFDGNTASLGKLGIGLSAAELKTMTFTEVQGKLTDMFGGAAAANADTYAGQIARVKVAFSEAQETIGTALLPILGKLLDFINKSALPAINAFSGAFSLTQGEGFGKVIQDVVKIVRDVATPIFNAMRENFNKMKDVIAENVDEFKAFFDVIKYIAPLIGKAIGGAFKVVGDVASVVFNIFANVLGAIKPLINTAIDGINLIISAYNKIPFVDDISLIPKIGASSGSSSERKGGSRGNDNNIEFDLSTPKIPDFTTTTGTTGGGGGGTGGGGGSTNKPAGAKIVVPVFDPERVGMTSGGRSPQDVFDPERVGMTSGGTTINVTVNGAIDKEGTARTIVDTLNDSYYRGTGGARQLVT